LEFPFTQILNIGLAIVAYLLGMAFAGSFLGRRWMGAVDVWMHRTFNLDVTIGKYVYWKHFCNISNPPKPPSLSKPKGLADMLFCRFLD
jgi:hypothetical protein